MKVKFFAVCASLWITSLAFAEDRIVGSDDYELCTLVHGTHLRSSDGADIGTVNDLIIDRRSGRIVNVVVATSEDKLIALPYSVVNVTGAREKNVIVLNVERERIVNAPTFTQTELRSLNRETIDRSVNYFQEGATGRPSTTKGGELQGEERVKTQSATTGDRGQTTPNTSHGVPPAIGESSPSPEPTAKKGVHKPGISPTPSATGEPSPKSSPFPTAPEPGSMKNHSGMTPKPSMSPRIQSTPNMEKARPTPALEESGKMPGASGSTPEKKLENTPTERSTSKKTQKTHESHPLSTPESTPK